MSPFFQSDWLKQYIDVDTKKRNHAKHDFENGVFKLLTNAVFGKTMENVQNRMELKLATENEKAIKRFSTCTSKLANCAIDCACLKCIRRHSYMTHPYM